MTEPDPGPTPAPPATRPTPWGVFAVVAVVIALGVWIMAGVREDARAAAIEAEAKKAAEANRPMILGRDIIPQEMPGAAAAEAPAAVSAVAVPSGAPLASAPAATGEAAPAGTSTTMPTATPAPPGFWR